MFHLCRELSVQESGAMLVIRKEQMLRIGEAFKTKFIDTMVQRVSKDFPAHFQALGAEDGARRLVQNAITEGAKYKIDTEGAVAVLIELMVVYGTKFEDSPDKVWAFRILEHPTMPGQLKVTMLRDRMGAKAQGRRIVRAEAAAAAGNS